MTPTAVPSSPPTRRVRARRGRPVACLALLALVTLPAGCTGQESPAATPEPTPIADDVLPEDAPPLPVDTPTIVQVVEPAPRPTGPLAPDAGCVTSACHAGFEHARFVHGAMSGGDCFVCHESDQGEHVYPLRREGNAGCTFCHPVVGLRTHLHVAVETPGCLACHEPHVAETKFLLNRPSVQEVCMDCHYLQPGNHAHGPFAQGECGACHLPHESDFRGLLRSGEGPDHCFACHGETKYVMDNAPYHHEPALDDCTTCHGPHAVDHPHGLLQPIDDTCFSCHEDLEQAVRDAAAPHAAVFTAERCANCHDPHGAGLPHLLRAPQQTLCMQCHDQPIEASDGRTIADMRPLLEDRAFLHGPVRAGECTACHNVHGASHARLLRERFTSEFYESFDLGNYALCFECHESELVLSAETTTLTGFRDGEQNLHYVHVNRPVKGRTCTTCHDIHGSNLPRHIAESVPFEGSQWAMPIGFEKTDTGGSCTTACHERMEYRRDRARTPVIPGPGGGS
ncbi:MAG: cytochrome c3 family protein [Planctomycetota bacterium]|jgi:predicted CXXCH cytochrome family protein